MSDYLWFEGIAFPALGYEKEILEEIGDMFVVRCLKVVLICISLIAKEVEHDLKCLLHSKFFF